MTTHPAQLFTLLLLGLASSAVLAAALYLLSSAYRPRIAPVRTPRPTTADAAFQADTDTVARQRSRRRKAVTVALALAMLLWVFAGRYLVAAFYPARQETPNSPSPASTRIRGASGAELAVHRYGSADGPTLVFTHGWGADRRDWEYAIGALPANFRIVAWDLPGLGESTATAENDYSMPTLAADLDSVVSSLKSNGPVILVGHSIGGILNLEYARRFPDKLGRDVRGLVQVNTTFTNPVETKKGAELSRKLQKPVFEPLLHVVAWTSPVVRAFGWLAYQSGLAHVQLAMQSFAGAETWQQLDQMASYAYRSSPGVIARGVLGMLHWDGSDVLPKIDVPTLIISGNQDTTTLPSASDRMERDIRSSVRVAVDRAAHLGPVEQYRTYAQAIGSFAARLSNDAAPAK